MPTIQFFTQNAKVNLRNRLRLKRFILSLFRSEHQALSSLNIIFCTDEALRLINNQYLNHDYYTDIITFDLTPTQTAPIEAELYISIDRVRDNARQLRQTIQHELHRVIFHGALHLCGYGDKSPREEKQMREKENHYLSRYFQ